MADIGYGYGSEWHLLRYLGRHRDLFDARVRELIPAGAIHWLDFDFAPGKRWSDVEIVRLDFLPETSPARQAWSAVWPTTGTPMNWDAVAELTTDRGREWLLVEAKANLQEIENSCDAKERGGLPLIRQTLDTTKTALGVPSSADWLRGSYQVANRIAALHHLNRHGEPSHLLFIYFCGDLSDNRRSCPAASKDWDQVLAEQDRHIGLPTMHALSHRIHKLFLDTCPQ